MAASFCCRWNFFSFIPHVGSHSSNIVMHATFLLTLRLCVWQVGCPRNKKKISVRTEPNRYRSVSLNQRQKISVCFGLFWCYQPISKQPKQTELFQNNPKQTGKNPKFSEKYQNMLSIKLFRLLFCLFGAIKTSKFSVSV
jgi:hypothetical protein